jgi:hypothetical protein
MNRLYRASRINVVLGLLFLTASAFADWPRAAGPNHDYQVSGRAPAAFSFARNWHIRWKTPLPNTGESTPVVACAPVFVTCHTPMMADAQAGREILTMCFDADSGEELIVWDPTSTHISIYTPRSLNNTLTPRYH